MHNGAFHRWLQYRLMHTFPNRNFEIINLSLTAVNSYTVLDFSMQIPKYQPDAVLIYSGHNEYYGALGIGSTSRLGGNYWWIQTVLTLRTFRFVQLMEKAAGIVTGWFVKQEIDTRDNLMQRMAASQQIPYGSADYQKGVDQFIRNIDKVCSNLAAHHIPVFLSTLVSNEKDMKPFISNKGRLSAFSYYQLAGKAYQRGDFATAKRQYITAIDYDLLRFRAPQAMNVAIRKIAASYTGVYLTDSRALFEQHSPGGVLGKETLLEHVHPNLLGYALLSEAFYQELKHSRLLRPQVGSEWTLTTLLNRMPVTTVDSLSGAYQIMMLKTGWPFNEPIDPHFKRGNSISEKIAGALAVNRISWLEAMDQLFRNYIKNNNKKAALKVTEAMILEDPSTLIYYIYAGRLCFETGDYNNARYYFKRAYLLDHSDASLQNLYLLALKTDQPKEALLYLNQLKKNQEVAAESNREALLLQEIVRLKQKSSKIGLNDSLRKRIALCYQQLNAEEAVAKYQQK